MGWLLLFLAVAAGTAQAGWPFLVLAAAAGAAGLLVRTWYWPLGPCPRCRARGRGRGWGSTAEAFNHDCACGGDGERIRPLSALIWPRHRAEARRRRDKTRNR